MNEPASDLRQSPAPQAVTSFDLYLARLSRLHRDALPRGLIFAWCTFLLAGWLAHFAVWDGPVAARWMLLLGLSGMLMFWPATRLCLWRAQWNDRPEWVHREATRRVMFDWLFLQSVFQVVIWPLSIIGGWSFGRLAGIVGLLIGWSLWAAKLTQWGLVSARSSRRTLAMLGCLGLAMGPMSLHAAWTIADPGVIERAPALWMWLADLSLPRLLWELSLPIDEMLEPWSIDAMLEWPSWLMLPAGLLLWAADVWSMRNDPAPTCDELATAPAASVSPVAASVNLTPPDDLTAQR